MEKWEKDCDLKAKKLLEEYKSSFKQMGYTIHDIRQYEQKGKASNVSWCVENL
jgi:predicted nucleic acid-binding Zn ribbon protein